MEFHGGKFSSIFMFFFSFLLNMSFVLRKLGKALCPTSQQQSAPISLAFIEGAKQQWKKLIKGDREEEGEEVGQRKC